MGIVYIVIIALVLAFGAHQVIGNQDQGPSPCQGSGCGIGGGGGGAF